MTPAELLYNLYQPTDIAVGRTQEVKDESTTGFKVKYKCWTERRKATLEDFQRHLDRVIGVGLPPINSESLCSWGAIDVDEYGGDISDFAKHIRLMFPFVLCVRSKSGGLHIYVFLTQPEPAEAFVPQLSKIAGALGYATSEIFPKQTKIESRNGQYDCGNWLNLPYFGGSSSTSYGLDKNGDAIPDIEAYVQEATRNQVDIGFLTNFQPPNIDQGDFSDGPPCLQTIWANGVGINRNTSLSNAAVYAKKKWPGDWGDKLKELNSKMAEPLSNQEVTTIIESYAKKDYLYQCQQSPLCQFCHAGECKKRDHGIGESSPFTGNRSLTKFDTDPPRWALDVETTQGTSRVNLSTDELQSPRLFQKRCMESINTVPSIPKSVVWEKELIKLFRNLTIVPVSHEDTPEGRLGELLDDYLSNRPDDERPENLLRDLPYFDGSVFHFRLPAFEGYLDSQRFRVFDHSRIIAALRGSFNASSYQRKLEGRNLRCWKMPEGYELHPPIRFAEFVVEQDEIF